MQSYFGSLSEEHNGDSCANIWQSEANAVAEQGSDLCSGFLLKVSSKESDQLARRYFRLGVNKLYCMKARDSSSACVMRLDHCMLTLPEERRNDGSPSSLSLKSRYPIQLFCRNKYTVLYAETADERRKWVEALSRVTTRTDFHSRFKYVRQLGEGGFAEVSECLEIETQRRYAVKSFTKESLELDSNGKTLVWNEIKILRRLDHANLLRLCELHESANSVYIVMDFVQGGELSKFIKQNAKLAELTIIQILLGLFRGLRHLHGLGIVHRDLKSSNVLLRQQENPSASDVVIVDFGLSTRYHETNAIYKWCGTPGSMSPEILRAQRANRDCVVADEKPDVFAIGLLGYTMMARKSPFDRQGLSKEEVIRKNMDCLVDYSLPVLAQYSEELNLLIRRCLDPDPNSRIGVHEALALPLFAQTRAGEDFEELEGSIPEELLQEDSGRLLPLRSLDSTNFPHPSKASHPSSNRTSPEHKLQSLPEKDTAEDPSNVMAASIERMQQYSSQHIKVLLHDKDKKIASQPFLPLASANGVRIASYKVL